MRPELVKNQRPADDDDEIYIVNNNYCHKLHSHDEKVKAGVEKNYRFLLEALDSGCVHIVS